MSELKGNLYVAPNSSIVQLESSVALRIINHGARNYPNTVVGSLLGVDVASDLLKITQSYPSPYILDDNSPYRMKNNIKYQEDLVEHLKTSNAAVQPLGWYQSSTSGKFITEAIIERLANAQLKNSSNSILLVHDPSKARYGLLSLKAFRLTKEFLETFTSGSFQVESLNKHGLNHDNIFEELPVKIHNNHLVSLYLSGLHDEDFNQTLCLESTNLKSKVTLTNIENLIESVDELSNFYYQQYKKKSSTGEISLQEWLILTSRIDFTSEDIEQQVLTQLLTDSAIRS